MKPILSRITEASAEFSARRFKSPTHLYITPETLRVCVDECGGMYRGGRLLGMQIVPCSEMPAGKADFFVAA